MPNEPERKLVSRVELGKRVDGEAEALVLIYRSSAEPKLELVVTARDNGDVAITLSPDDARRIGQTILDAAQLDSA